LNFVIDLGNIDTGNTENPFDDFFPLTLRSGFSFQPNLSSLVGDINIGIGKLFADDIGNFFCRLLVCVTQGGRWCMNEQAN